MPILRREKLEEVIRKMMEEQPILPLEPELERQTLEEMLKTNVTTAFEVPEDYLNDSYNDHQADIFRYAISQINKGDSKMNKNQIAFSALIHVVMLALFASVIGEQVSEGVFTYFDVMKAYVLVMVFYWFGYATIKL